MRVATGLLFAAVFFALFPRPAAAEPLAIEVVGADVEIEPHGNRPIVWIRMKPETSRALLRLTTENVNRRIDIRVDGKSMMKPVIRAPVRSERMPITGTFTVEQADALAKRIASGASRVEVEAADAAAE
jgi:preprotein translocase subunit SecD